MTKPSKEYKIKTRLAGDFDAPWFDGIYRKVWWGWEVFVKGKAFRIIQGKPKICSMRKTVTKNFNKWKYRRKTLNAALKKKEITIWQEYWWAKFWRKGKTLRVLIEELKDTEELPNYSSTNRDRYFQILDALNQTEKHYQQYDPLFINVDPKLGWQCDTFKDFIKENKKLEKYKVKMPRQYIAYYKP